MRHSLITLLLALSSFTVFAQGSLNMELLGHLPYSENLSDVRGAVHNGREYALVGVYNGFSIVDVSNPANPVQVFFAPGSNSIWRDPFYYNGHAYCVNETSGGLLIVDMSPLPAPGTPPVYTNLTTVNYTGSQFPWTKAHNMSFDEQGHAYIYGANYGVGGTIILDCSQNPAAPVELGVWNQYYVHDGFVRGDTLWAACVNDGFAAVVDISNPQSPAVLTTWATPSNFTHNIWPSDDNSTVYTTDEVIGGFVAAYDVTDLSNVIELDRVHNPLTTGVIPHNAHFFNGYVVTSHYRDGVTIHDASDPSNVILTGFYDSSPLSGEGFNGSWGTWPYLPSGILLNADIEEGLFILAPTYIRAARIEGTVTSASNGVPLSGVNISITGITAAESTGIAGTYASGRAESGTVSVTFVKGGYLPLTVDNVELVNGEVTVLDVQLTPDIPFTLEVDVVDANGGAPIEGATITFVNSLFDIDATTDVEGLISDDNFFDGTYDITIGHWGHVTQCTTLTLTGQSNSVTFALEQKYFDDFALDLGWQVSGNAPAGIWERDAPIATFYENATVNPGSDAGLGCGNFAYVTGNGGGAAGEDDVDDGATILTSPVMDLTGLDQPMLTFHYWFFTGGGSSASNDELLVKVNNGIDLVTITSLSTTGGEWLPEAINLAQFLTITENMRVQFHVADAAPGHLVEAGIDQFSIENWNGVPSSASAGGLRIYPNPSTGIDVFLSMPSFSPNTTLRIFDLQGREVASQQSMTTNPFRIAVPQQSGIYVIEVNDNGNRTFGRLAVNAD